MPHHLCYSAKPTQFFPKSVRYIVVTNFESIPAIDAKILLQILREMKLPVNYYRFDFVLSLFVYYVFQFIITSQSYGSALKRFASHCSDVFVAMESHWDMYNWFDNSQQPRSIEMSKTGPIQKSVSLKSKN